MANINIQKQPNYLSAANSPIIYNLTSAAENSIEQKARVQINVNSAIEGATIIFNDIVFYCKDNPGYGEFFSSLSHSPIQVTESIAFALNENPVINRKYIASFNNTSVIIESLESGALFTPIVSINPNGSNMSVSIQAGLDRYRGQRLNNYGVWVDLYINNSDKFGATSFTSAGVKISSFEKLYQKGNNHYFDLSGILSKYVSSPVPILTNKTQIKYIPLPITGYFIVYGESYSAEGTNYRRKYQIGTSVPRFTWNAAFDLMYGYSSTGYYSSKRKFLTNAPVQKTINKDQEEFLYYLFQTYNGSVSNFHQLKVEFDFIDGTTYSTIKRINKTSVVDGGIYSVNVSPSVVGLNAVETAENKIVKSYSVELEQVQGSNITGTTISEKRTYVINQDCYNSRKRFLFVNSLGGYDSFEFIGSFDNTPTRELNTFYKTQTYNVVRTDSYKTVQSAEVKNIKKVNSGWIDKEHFDWLIELLKSPNVYEISENNLLEYVLITDVDYKFNSEDQLYSITATVERTLPENSIKN